jgi:polysaccharide pyruvyl transferase WcaK-like protein
MTRKRTPPTAIGLFGLFGCGNSGNDGSLEAMLIFLRQVLPDARLACVCPAPDKVERDYNVEGVATASPTGGPITRFLNRLLFGMPHRAANWVHAVAQMRKLDLLIIPGTGILDDFGTGPWAMPYMLFRWCLCARLCGREVWFVSIGAGPIHHPTSRQLMKWAAAMAQYRSYRDTISKEFVESIGLGAHSDPVYPDLAFKLPAAPAAARRHDEGEGLTVGVGVMNYGGWRGDLERRTDIVASYREKVVRFLCWLFDHEYRVRLLTGDSFDQPMVDDLAQGLAENGRTAAAGWLAAEPTLTLHALMREIALTDVVVATRYHNVVCALKLARPTISVGYADKNDALLADMGLGDFCQHIERLDVDRLIEQFTAIVADRRRHERRIMATVRAYERRLAEQDALLASRLAIPTGPESPSALRSGGGIHLRSH